MEFPKAPEGFLPPAVRSPQEGVVAFRAYDWYYRHMRERMCYVDRIFLVPCAKTKPIYQSFLHRTIYQKLGEILAQTDSRRMFVVSEPVVLIDYRDLRWFKEAFCYDFPPALLNAEARNLFVERLRTLFAGKDIVGCLPKHHAALVHDAIGTNWTNLWYGDMFAMLKAVRNPTEFLEKKHEKYGSVEPFLLITSTAFTALTACRL